MNLSNKYHPKYEPEKWNKNKYIKKTHNCYAYALNIIHKKQANICKKYMELTKKYDCPFLRPQPGKYSGCIDIYKSHLYNCKTIEKRMFTDNPLIKKLKKNEECPDNYYKIALVCLKDGSDYHFYRQDNNGLWSHKDGWRLATNKDFKGKLIKNPETANKGKSYSFCGYYMVPNSSKHKNMSNRIKKKNKKSENYDVLNMIYSNI